MAFKGCKCCGYTDPAYQPNQKDRNMNDRVKQELLAAAAIQNADELMAHARGGPSNVITAQYKGQGYSFRDDGWFNATEAAKRYGKRPAEWLRLPEAIRYIAARCARLEVGKSHFVKTMRGGDRSEQGTWLHPKLAVVFARWLDVEFEIWCDEQIDKILHGQMATESEDRLTTVGERMPLLEIAHHVFARTGIFYPQTYAAINAAAGSDCYRLMKTRQAARVLPPAIRIISGVDSQSDWELLHIQKRELSDDPQLELGLSEHGPLI